MQKHITTTANDPTASDPTAPTAPTFEQLAAARRDARAEEQAAAARDEEARDMEKRTNAIAKWNLHVADRISDDLQEALQITVTVEHTDPDDPTSDYRATGRFTSPITGNPCELYVGYRYGDHFPVLHLLTTNQYIHLPERYMREQPEHPLDAPILDALDDEPRRIAEQEQAAREAADQPDRQAGASPLGTAAAATKPPCYASICGNSDETQNLLRPGAHIWLTVETPELDEHTKHHTHCYELVDWSNTWILVSNGRGSQWLIPVARIVDIQPASASVRLS